MPTPPLLIARSGGVGIVIARKGKAAGTPYFTIILRIGQIAWQ